MDKCMPIKYVRMSTRNPMWMTPLVKSLFRVKSRISLNNEERLRLINNIISEVISENRRNPRVMIGSQRWWESVDSISQRRNSSQISLNPESLDRLNDHFGQICYDDNYIPLSDVTIVQGVEIPKISEKYVWNILSRIKKNSHRTRYVTILGMERSLRDSNASNYAYLESVIVCLLIAKLLEEG